MLPRPIEELDEALATEGLIWLDLEAPTAQELAELADRFDIDPLSLQDVIDITLLPKVDHYSSYLFIVLHGVVTSGQTRLATEELDLIIGDRFLVTAHRVPMAAVDWVAGNLESSALLNKSDPAALAAAVADAGSRRYLPLLDALEAEIEELEDSAIIGDPVTLGASQALRRDVIVLRRILGPQRDVMRQLSQSESSMMSSTARRAFGDVYDHHFRLVESLDAARALLASVLDTYRGAMAERTNEVMKVLTVFSAIMLPLSLIAGLWGMNFDRIPASQWQWGFIGLLGLMSAIAVGLWIYFSRRGFIGGPRLRELPKALGLGLVQLGTAPLRIVVDRIRDQGDSSS